MADLEIPKITKPVNLSDYAPEFGERYFLVWVNPPRKLRLAAEREYMALQVAAAGVQRIHARADKAQGEERKKLVSDLEKAMQLFDQHNSQLCEHLAKLLVDSPEAEYLDAAGLEAVSKKSVETDPVLMWFLFGRIIETIKIHRGAKKKNSNGRPLS